MKKLSIIADEISQDPHAAVHIGTKLLDLHQFELRFIMNERVPDISTEKVEELLWIREHYDISYSAVAAGLFKCLPEAEALKREMERMEMAIELAVKLGVKTVTGFALHDVERHRSEEFREIIVPYLQETCRRAETEGISFAVETEYMTGCETAKDAQELVRRVATNLKINWDPANCWVAGEHPLEGYAHVKGLIGNMHVKDADSRDWRAHNPFVAFGDGFVPWPQLLPVLYRDVSIERLTLETHIKPVITKTETGVTRIKTMLSNLLRSPDV